MTRGSIERRLADLEREDDEEQIILCNVADLDTVREQTAGRNVIIIVDDIANSGGDSRTAGREG